MADREGTTADDVRKSGPPDTGGDANSPEDRTQPDPISDNGDRLPCWACGRLDCVDLGCGIVCKGCERTPDELHDYGHAPDCPEYAHKTEGAYSVAAADIRSEHVQYLEDGIIPLRVVTLMTGIDGVGKSTILYEKAALATRGKLPGKFKGEPITVVIASCEDHPGSVIRPRLLAAGADLKRVRIIKVRRDGIDGEISLPEDLPEVADEVSLWRARVLIIDPLVAHMPLQVDTHKAQHVRSVLAPLARLAEENWLAVLAVVHFNGAASTDVRTRISGSKALRDAARSVLVAGVDPNDESRHVLVQDKFSFGPKPNTGRAYRIETIPVEDPDDGKTYETSGVVWLGEVEIDAHGLLAGPGDPEDRTERDEAVEFLRSVLPADGSPIDSSEVKKAAVRDGIKERTLHRARRKLGVIVERQGFNRAGSTGSTWALPFVPPPRGTNGDGEGWHERQSPYSATDSADPEPRSCHSRDGGTNGEPSLLDSGETDTPEPADPGCDHCGSSPATSTIRGRLCPDCSRRSRGATR